MTKPSGKRPRMEKAIDRMSEHLFGRSRTQSIKGDMCVTCGAKAPPESFKDDLSRKEYTISGMCQSCQDGTFEPELSKKIGWNGP